MRFILGPLGIYIGIMILLKAEWLLSNFGRIEWAERLLSTEGGSRLAYKFIGILVIIISFLYLTGGLGSIILSVLGPLFVRPGN